MDAIDISKSFHYTPHRGVGGRPNQWDFHKARHKSIFRVMLTGKRGGKTTGGVAEDIFWAMNYPGCVGWCGEPSFPMVERNLIPAIRQILGVKGDIESSPVVESHNESKHFITFKNGSILWLGSMDNPESIEGATLDYFHLDEARLCHHFDLVWDSLSSRISGTGALPKAVKPQAWITSTPAPINSDMWVKLALESPDHIDGIRLFSWYLSDNSSLEDWYVRMMNSSNKTESQRQAFLFGMWASGTIGTLPFDYNRHVFRDMSIVPDDDYTSAIMYGVDWGYSPDPFALVVIIFDKYGRAYLVDEFYEVGFNVLNRATKAKEFGDNWGYGTWWCDAHEPGFIKTFRDKQLDARPWTGKIDERIENLAGWLMDGDDGMPRLRIWHECKSTILEMSQYIHGEKDSANHAIDACSYALAGHDSHRPLSLKVVEKEHRGLKYGRKVDTPLQPYSPVSRMSMKKPKAFVRGSR